MEECKKRPLGKYQDDYTKQGCESKSNDKGIEGSKFPMTVFVTDSFLILFMSSPD